MRRRHFFSGLLAAAPMANGAVDLCGCAPALQTQSGPVGANAFLTTGSKLKITNVKVFGVSLTPDSDRPYVFVKIETNQGIVGWGEGTLEGKAAAVMACVEDFKEFLIGADPMQVLRESLSGHVSQPFLARTANLREAEGILKTAIKDVNELISASPKDPEGAVVPATAVKRGGPKNG